MTPDQARDLLAGTTPGPWDLSSSRSVVGIDIVMYDGTAMERRNVTLAAAAPTLAAMIAGMREEWGVKWDDDPNGLPDWGFPTRAAAEQWEKKHRHRGPGRGRIVRRYVTEPEVADARWDLPVHRTEAGYPNCSTCDGGGCPDCTDPA